MTATPVLIAALSARALAASAKRAGFRPLVVDCFGDHDLVAAPNDVRTLSADVRTGFDGRELLTALKDLASGCDEPPIGLVLGSGFEDRPRLIDKLANAFALLGCDGETTAALKDPAVFFALLDRLKISHPKSSKTPPSVPEGWLRKRIGASGGLHIRPCRANANARSNRYFQRQISGDAVSILGVIGGGGKAFAISRQWLSPNRKTPFRYGGAVSNISLPADVENELLDASVALTEAAGVQGLVSIDFIVDDGDAYCLEINPRPGASIEIHDDDAGTLFEAHVMACQGTNPADFLKRRWSAPQAKASAYLYADQGPVRITRDRWPDWVHDRPTPGTTVPRGQPLASVSAEAETAEAAEQICRERLAGLEKMLYDTENGKETRQ